MKKISVLLIVVVFALVLSACNNPTGKSVHQNGDLQRSDLTEYPASNEQTDVITREKALEIALDKVGVKQSDIRDLDIELDLERGGRVWEIDFEHGSLEYSYDIDAETGEVTQIERERD